MIDQDRLEELDTLRIDEDTPDHVRISLPVGDVRDLVQLISVVRAGIALRDEAARGPWTDSVWAAIKRFDEERCAT